jgi:hypothetical protein
MTATTMKLKDILNIEYTYIISNCCYLEDHGDKLKIAMSNGENVWIKDKDKMSFVRKAFNQVDCE